MITSTQPALQQVQQQHLHSAATQVNVVIQACMQCKQISNHDRELKMPTAACRVRRAFRRSASCHQKDQQTPTHPQPQPHPSQQLQTAVCQPAAANAAAIYTATVTMHTTITTLRSYYNQQQQQQATAGSSSVSGAVGSAVPLRPSVSEVCALVVGVSRLVQMEYGALHGQGECHLRDQVILTRLDGPDKVKITAYC
jgi:hypothetical protein